LACGSAHGVLRWHEGLRGQQEGTDAFDVPPFGHRSGKDAAASPAKSEKSKKKLSSALTGSLD
jgi:hypothetical protein